MTFKGVIENVLASIIATVMIESSPMAGHPAAHKAELPEPIVYQSQGRVEAELSWMSVTVEWERSVGSSQEGEDEK